MLTNSFTRHWLTKRTHFFLDYRFAVVIRCALRLVVCANNSTFTKAIKSNQISAFGRVSSRPIFYFVVFNTDDGAIGGQFAALALKL